MAAPKQRASNNATREQTKLTGEQKKGARTKSAKPVTAKQHTRLFGSHLSIAGGLHLAVEKAESLQLTALQIFTKSQKMWAAKPLTEDAVASWSAALQASQIRRVVVHASYLINLAAADDTLRTKSIDAAVIELQRADQLGIPDVVLHPGHYGAKSVGEGIRRVVEGVDEIHRRTAGARACLVLEVTAGGGSSLGGKLEEIGLVISESADPDRLGVCLDTAHLCAAGYDLSQHYDDVMQAMDAAFGFARVRCIHTNDSAKPLGSHVDRHAHINQGYVGEEAFRRLLNDPTWVNVPFILETPKGEDEKGRDYDALNVAELKRLISDSQK